MDLVEATRASTTFTSAVAEQLSAMSRMSRLQTSERAELPIKHGDAGGLTELDRRSIAAAAGVIALLLLIWLYVSVPSEMAGAVLEATPLVMLALWLTVQVRAALDDD